MRRVKFIVKCLLVLLVCALAILYVIQQQPTHHIVNNTVLSSSVDSIAINVAFQEFDQSGTQVHAFTSTCMRHMQKNNTHMFTRPRIKILANDQPPMNLRADSAISIHAGKSIEFKHNVHLNTIASTKSPATHVQTESLTYVPQQQQVMTKDQVFFTQADTHGQARGMTANLATHQLHLAKDLQIDQKDTHLRAQSVTTYGDAQHPLLSAFISGNELNPAHYWSILHPNEPTMHAHAEHMLFNNALQTIELTGQARIIQGPQSFTAPQISYDLAHQHVISSPTTLARTTIVIYPEKKT